VSRFGAFLHGFDDTGTKAIVTKVLKVNGILEMVQSLPTEGPVADDGPSASRGVVSRSRSDPQMGASDKMAAMLALEEKLRGFEEEIVRLRVENEQLRRSSQAFGELAERLSVALRTATRVNRKPTMAADGRRRVISES
jgi:hypothetical protein